MRSVRRIGRRRVARYHSHRRFARGPASTYNEAKTDLQLKIEKLVLEFVEDASYEGDIRDPDLRWYGLLSQKTWDLVDMVDTFKI